MSVAVRVVGKGKEVDEVVRAIRASVHHSPVVKMEMETRPARENGQMAVYLALRVEGSYHQGRMRNKGGMYQGRKVRDTTTVGIGKRGCSGMTSRDGKARYCNQPASVEYQGYRYCIYHDPLRIGNGDHEEVKWASEESD